MSLWFCYTLNVSIFLLINYMVYSLLIADVRQPRFNRALLWLIALMSFVMPFAPSIPMIGGVHIDMAAVGAGTAQNAGIADGASSVDVMLLLVTAYLAGVLALTVYNFIGLFRLIATVRNNRCEKCGDVFIVHSDKAVSPFSWLNFIVVDSSVNAGEQAMIIEHEKSHIRRRHSVDLALAAVICIVLWYNPAVWLWRRQLAMVHEYEADNDVVESGVDARQYQMLLIKKAVGSRLQSLANNLTHSKLKKRITMMCKKQDKRVALLRTLAIVPAMCGAMAVVNIPSVAAAIDFRSPAAAESKGEVTEIIANRQMSAALSLQSSQNDKAETVKVPSQLPSFPGGEAAMWQFMLQNLRYPEAAFKAKIEGKVIVKFVVAADGAVTDVAVENPVNPELDAEAVRVVKAMPKWNPGIDGGKAVNVSMVIPVMFKLQ